MDLRIEGIPTSVAEHARGGGADAHGQPAVEHDALGPCRHCLVLITEGESKLALAYQPFDEKGPYAEVGPIFVHHDTCERYRSAHVPDWFAFLDPAAVRGYDDRHWIRYDTGQIVRGPEIEVTCRSILADPSIAYVHVRSKFGCFQCRVDRAD